MVPTEAKKIRGNSPLAILSDNQDIACSARFVLLVEKECVYLKLLENQFWKKFNCLIFTGKGYPSYGMKFPGC